jgi:hypothetical protein
MYARAVDDAAVRLRELRLEEWDDLVLAGVAFSIAVTAAYYRPQLALPFFLGGLAVLALSLRALWRRCNLVDLLSGERDAYVISEVLDYASREATMERRHSFASIIRVTLRRPGFALDASMIAAREELDALAAELEDGELALDPDRAVACMRLLSDLDRSPLFNSALPPDELRARVRQIRAGFRHGRSSPQARSVSAPMRRGRRGATV